MWRYLKSFTDAVELGFFCLPVRPDFALHPVFEPIPELSSQNVSDCQCVTSLGQWSLTGGDFCPLRDMWQYLETVLVVTTGEGAVGI